MDSSISWKPPSLPSLPTVVSEKDWTTLFVILSFFVLKDVLVILDPQDFRHRASLDSVSGTHCLWGKFYFSWPEYNSSSPKSGILCSPFVYWVFLISRTLRLYFLSPVSIWVILPFSYTNRTFHLLILTIALVTEIDIGLVISEESPLSPSGVLTLLYEDL